MFSKYFYYSIFLIYFICFSYFTYFIFTIYAVIPLLYQNNSCQSYYIISATSVNLH